MKKHTTATRSARATSGGFTLMELIVAVSLTLLMMILIGNIFDQTRRTIARGTGTGDINANSRALSSQLVMDLDQMVGPHDNNGRLPEESGGVLVISYRYVGDWNGNLAFTGDTDGDGRITPDEDDVMDDATEGVLFARQGNTYERRLVRGDQIAFVASRRPGQQPVTPAGPDTFVPHNDDGMARFVLVTYGHANRTLSDGDDFDPGADNPTLDGHFGKPGADHDGQRFILGRHALFLGEPSSRPSQTLPTIYTNSPSHLAAVTGMGSYPHAANVFMGLTDYAEYSLDDPSVVRLVGAAATTPAPFLEAPPAPPLLSVQKNTYDTAALALAFTSKRLRVNPQPDAPTWEAWRVAQMHGYFMEYASDFIIEVAGDYQTDIGDPLEPDGNIDTVGADPNLAGTDGLGRNYSYSANTMKWYVPDGFQNNWVESAVYDSTKPLTWTMPLITSAGVGYNPNVDVSVYGPPPHTDRAFVFRHDDEDGRYTGGAAAPTPSLWPHLLRFRYRLHDPRGELNSGSGQHGLWFEQVVAVNRPRD